MKHNIAFTEREIVLLFHLIRSDRLECFGNRWTHKGLREAVDKTIAILEIEVTEEVRDND
jgi:hypothetical protein